MGTSRSTWPRFSTATAYPTLHVGLDEAEAGTAATRGQLAYQGRLDTEELPETVRALGLASAVALSGPEHLDRYADERIAKVVGTSNIYGVEDPHSEAEVGTTQTIAVQTILPAELTADVLAALHANGYRLLTVPGNRPRLGWLTIGRIDDDNTITFEPDPGNADDDLLIQFGPVGRQQKAAKPWRRP